MSKKIVIYGASWRGTLTNLLAEELRRKGKTVEVFDFTDILPGIKVRTFAQRLLRKLGQRYFENKLNLEFLKFVEKSSPDVVLIEKGLNLYPSTVRALKQSTKVLANWNPDDFFNSKNSNPGLLEAMVEYDIIFSARPHLFEDYGKQTSAKLVYLDWYYVPELHHPVETSVCIEASFVGSWSPFREDFLSKLSSRFYVRGGGWEKASAKLKQQHDVTGEILSQEQMVEVFNRSKFNLNLLTHENNDRSNLRLFEVTASGGLLLTQRNSLAESLFEDRKECLMFDGPAEVNEVMNSSSLKFDEIKEAGYARVISGSHRFEDRINSLIGHLSL